MKINWVKRSLSQPAVVSHFWFIVNKLKNFYIEENKKLNKSSKRKKKRKISNLMKNQRLLNKMKSLIKSREVLKENMKKK